MQLIFQIPLETDSEAAGSDRGPSPKRAKIVVLSALSILLLHSKTFTPYSPSPTPSPSPTLSLSLTISLSLSHQHMRSHRHDSND